MNGHLSDRQILVRIWWSVWIFGIAQLVATLAILAVVSDR